MKNSPTPATTNHNIALILLVSTFMTTLAVSSSNILLPALVVSLNTTFASVQWVSIAYLIALSSTLVIGGRLSDLFGTQKLFICGMLIFMLGAGLCALSSNIWQLALCRAIQGCGAAIIIAVNLAIIAELFAPEKVGRMMGLTGSMSALGTASGPVIGGIGAQWLNWQSVFFINIPLGLLVLGMALRYFPANPEPRQLPIGTFDKPGALLVFLTILSYALILKLLPVLDLWLSLLFAGITLIFFGLFIVQQGQDTSSLLDIMLLTDKCFSLSYGINFIVSIVAMSSLVVLPFYLTTVFQLSLAQAGLVMLCSPLCVASTSAIVGRLVNHTHPGTTVAAGLVVMGLGTTTMVYVDFSWGLGGLIGCLLVIAMGYGTFTASNNTQVMLMAAKHQRGQVSGLLNLSRNIGLLTAATVISNVFDILTRYYSGYFAGSIAMQESVNQVYVLASVLLCLALVLRLCFPKPTISP